MHPQKQQGNWKGLLNLIALGAFGWRSVSPPGPAADGSHSHPLADWPP